MQEQDKSTFIGLLLIGLLFVVFNLMVEPPEEPAIDAQTTTLNSDSLSNTTNSAQANASTNTTNNQAANNKVIPTGNFLQTATAEQFHTISNNMLELTFSNKGGRLYKAQVKTYNTYDSLPVVLFDGAENVMNYTFAMNRQAISTQDYFFDIVPNGNNAVALRLYTDSSKNSYLEQNYALEADGYFMKYDLNFVNFNQIFANNSYLELDWKTYLRQQEKDAKSERFYTGVYYREGGEDVEYLSETSDDEAEVSTSLDWVAFKQQFFNTTLIAEKPFKRASLSITQPEDEDSPILETTTANLKIEYKQSPSFNYPMQMYLGPNEYTTLETAGLDLEELVPLGWGIFGWVNRWIIIPFFNFLNQYIVNYGVIILILTLVIKAILFPLTYRSYRSFASMSVLKPEIALIKEKYGKDAQRVQAETMKLYGKAGVNPLGGCLPQMLQMPILFAMYRFFPASIELRQESFLWADDLSSYDSVLNLPFSIPFYGDHVSLFTLLACASMFVYMRLNQQMTPQAGSDQMAQQMKIIQYFMPVMLLFVFNSFSAGLTFYFLLSNIISFTQQYVIKNYFINEEKLLKQIQENRKKPKKKSGFQSRLDEMLKQQQEAQKKRQKDGNQRRSNSDGNSTNDSKPSGSNKTNKKRKRK